MKHVGIWIRVSTEEQAGTDSPEHHERRAHLYAEAKGWKVVEVYHLEAVSGKSVIEHAEAKRMLADVKSGKITALIFSKLARLARNTKELLEFADYFRDHNADLVSLGESIDTSSPAGRLFYTMIAALAEWERSEITARIQASVPIRAKLGKQLGGQSAYGYVWKNGSFVVEPSEAPVRKLIYELYKECRRMKTVARLLNERGYRTRTKASWTGVTIERLLRDPTAKGIRIANYSKSAGTGKAALRKPESDWVYHNVEAIIPESLWDECQAILGQQRRAPKPMARKPVHLFAGVTYCTCGDKMYVPSNSPKYTCRTCRSKIPVVDLEGIYHDKLTGFLLNPEELSRHAADGDELVGQKQALVDVLTSEHAKVTSEIDKLYTLYQADQIDGEGFGRKYRPLNARLLQLDDELPAREAELSVMRISHLSQAKVQNDARDLAGMWPTLPPAEKRSIIEAITDKIIVGERSIEISLLYTPPLDRGNKGTLPHGFIAAIS